MAIFTIKNLRFFIYFLVCFVSAFPSVYAMDHSENSENKNTNIECDRIECRGFIKTTEDLLKIKENPKPNSKEYKIILENIKHNLSILHIAAFQMYMYSVFKQIHKDEQLPVINYCNIDAINNLAILFEKLGEIEGAKKFYSLAITKNNPRACLKYGLLMSAEYKKTKEISDYIEADRYLRLAYAFYIDSAMDALRELNSAKENN